MAPRWGISLLKVAVGVALLALLLYWIDWRKALALLVGVKLFPLLLALLCMPAGFLVSSIKWRLLLSRHGLPASLKALFQIYWIGFFFSNFFPSNVGGDVVRIAFLRRPGKLAEITASTVVERLSGLVILLLLAALALKVRPGYFAEYGLLPLLWTVIVLSLSALGAGLLAGGRLSAWLMEAVGGKENSLARVVTKAARLISALVYFRRHPRTLAHSLVLSLGFYVILVSFQYLLFVSLDIDLAFREVVFIAPIIALVSMLPISFNALGIAEGAFVFFYGQAGVGPEAALAAALLRRLVHLLISLVGGGVWFSHRFSCEGQPKP